MTSTSLCGCGRTCVTDVSPSPGGSSATSPLGSTSTSRYTACALLSLRRAKGQHQHRRAAETGGRGAEAACVRPGAAGGDSATAHRTRSPWEPSDEPELCPEGGSGTHPSSSRGSSRPVARSDRGEEKADAPLTAWAMGPSCAVRMAARSPTMSAGFKKNSSWQSPRAARLDKARVGARWPGGREGHAPAPAKERVALQQNRKAL